MNTCLLRVRNCCCSLVVASVSGSRIAYIMPTVPPEWFTKDLPSDMQSIILSQLSVYGQRGNERIEDQEFPNGYEYQGCG